MVKLATWEASLGGVEFGLEKREVKGCEVIWKGDRSLCVSGGPRVTPEGVPSNVLLRLA